MILDELVALLAFDVDDKNLKAFNDKISEGIQLVAGFSATVVAAGGALFGMAKLTADAGDEAAKMAEKFGISTSTYQELMYAARGEAQALAGSMTFLSKSMTAANDGSKAQADAFQKLGVKYKDSTGKLRPAEEMISDLADGFMKLPDGPTKAALAMDIFGKSGTELIPFLNQGSKEIGRMRQEAQDLGFVLGEEAVANSQKFQDVMDDTKNMLIGIRNTVGAGLIPIINKLGGRVQEFIKINRSLIATRVEKFFQILSDYAERGWNFLNHMYEAASGLARVFGGLGNVISFAATAMLAFASAKILFTIGSMIMLVNKLGTAFTIANAKALLIPILIGAAVVALGLIIEDIVAFFQGKDSVTGVIVEKFKEMFAWLEEGFSGMSGWVKGFVTVLLTPLRMLINTFGGLLDIINAVRGKMSLGDLGKSLGARWLNNFGIGGDGGLKGAIGLSNLASSGTASAAAGINPSSSVSASNQSLQNNIEMPVTVQVGEGVDPFAVGKAVSTQTGNNLDSILRGTKRSFSGARSSQ